MLISLLPNELTRLRKKSIYFMDKFQKIFLGILIIPLFVCNNISANDISNTKLAKLSINPISLRCDKEDFTSTQYTIDWYWNSDDCSEILYTTICENRAGNSHVLFMTKNKLPFAYLGPGISFYATNCNQFAYVKNLKFCFDCDNIRLPNFRLSNDLKSSHATLDTFNMIHDLLGNKFDCNFHSHLDRYYLAKGESKVLIDSSRRYERGRFPVASFRVQAKDGTGYMIRNIHRGLPKNTIVTRCYDYTKQCIEDVEISREVDLQENLIYELLPLDNTLKISKIINDASCQRLRQHWKDQLLLASSKKRENLNRTLIKISNKNPDTGITESLNMIHKVIALDIHLPSLESRTGGDATLSTYVEPGICRSFAVRNYGINVIEEIENALIKAITNPKLEETIRLKSIDYLQTLNILESNESYNQLLSLSNKVKHFEHCYPQVL